MNRSTIAGVARGHGYEMVLCSSIENPDREVNVLRAPEDKRIDGTIIGGSRLPDGRLSPRLRGQRAAVLVDGLARTELVSARASRGRLSRREGERTDDAR